MWRTSGIIDVGCSVPRLRIGATELAVAMGVAGTSGMKSVPNRDEDVTTLAYEAAARVVENRDAESIRALWVGTETRPNAVGPTAMTVASLLGLSPQCGTADLEFACRGAIEALWGLLGRIESGETSRAIVVGADCAHAGLDDPLVYSTGAGAAALLLGNGDEVCAVISHHETYATDTPDFWRRDGELTPSHAHRFTGEPGYFRHQLQAAGRFFEKSNSTASDYRYAIFHQPNRKFVDRIAARLGFSRSQYEPSLFVEDIGNCYAANVFLGLARLWPQLAIGDTVFVSAYGSGAGADAFAIKLIRQPVNLQIAADFSRAGFTLPAVDYLARRAYAGGQRT